MTAETSRYTSVPPTSVVVPASDKSLVASTTAAKIMIVDDEPVNIKVVRKYLQGCGYDRFVTTSDAREAVDLVRNENPDLVLLDVMMPHVNGLTVLQQLRSDDRYKYLPVLVLTASTDPETKFQALNLGATDFLAKPVDPSDLSPRVRNALLAKAHQDQLANQAVELERQVRARTAELTASQRDVIFCLARAGEYRDHDTGNHVIRVGLYVGVVARQLGINEALIELMEQAALLHDVGKIGISDLILLKPGRLTDEEFEQIKRHCEYGRSIIEPNTETKWRAVGASRKATSQERVLVGRSPIMSMASRIAYTHHERWDGTGYPCGLKGKAIPIEGRITAVADVYDALSSRRPYKDPLPHEKCLELMKQDRGTHFDPRVLDAFLATSSEIERIRDEYMDED